jgi:hypothetical protein
MWNRAHKHINVYVCTVKKISKLTNILLLNSSLSTKCPLNFFAVECCLVRGSVHGNAVLTIDLFELGSSGHLVSAQSMQVQLVGLSSGAPKWPILCEYFLNKARTDSSLTLLWTRLAKEGVKYPSSKTVDMSISLQNKKREQTIQNWGTVTACNVVNVVNVHTTSQHAVYF